MMEERINGGRQHRYRRILRKLSGEALLGQKTYGIDQDVLARYAVEIKHVVENGGQVAIVIGGGNIFRGVNAAKGMTRSHADYMGMLATMTNAMALQYALEQAGVQTLLQSLFMMQVIQTDFAQLFKSIKN